MVSTSINKSMKLSEHFTLGELTKTSYHTTDGNIPSRVAIENLKNICENWLEELRRRYNEKYGEGRPGHTGDRPPCNVGDITEGSVPSVSSDIPIVINSGYRSEEVNRKCGGAKGSNHLTGCAVDIGCLGPEQMIRYACILLDTADENGWKFDELIQEKRGSTYWVHFAVRPKDRSAQGDACQSKNRRKILFDCK